MTQRVQDAEDVDRHVREVASAVVDDQVQVHVVRRPKASARQRARDRDAADEWRDPHQRADETHRHLHVWRGVGGVVRGPGPDRDGARSVRAQDDQLVCEGQLGRGGDRPANILLADRATQARACQLLHVERKAATRQERYGSPDSLRRGRGLGWRMADQGSASHNRTAYKSDTTPGY